MSGSPMASPQSNMAGSDETCEAAALEVCVGTSHSGSPPVFGSVTLFEVNEASDTDSDPVSRGSMKTSSGAAPLLVIVTGTVIGAPAGSVVLALSGRPTALTLTPLNAMLPVYGSDTSFPTTGSPNATISVHVPATGSSV